MFNLWKKRPKPSLKKVMNAAAWPYEPEVEKRLDAIEQRGIKKSSPEEICRLIQFFKYAIEAQCVTDGSVLVKDKRRTIIIPQNGFQREIDALTVLAGGLHFSQPFHDWVDDRLKALAFRMARSHNADKMRLVWHKMDENGRLAYLRAVQAMQAHIFSEDHLTIRNVDVNPGKLSENVLGSFKYGAKRMEKGASMEIVIDPKQLDDSTSDMATSVTVHEGLHSILQQMALAQHSGEISGRHKLYKDFKLIHLYAEYECYLDSRYREAYKADLEERVCNKHRDYRALYEQQSALHKNQTERIRPRP